MTALARAEIPLDTSAPAQRLRRMAAAVRVAFTWWGVHRTLTAQQKEEVCDAYGADARLLSAGKKIIDVRHEAFRKLTSVRSRIASHWRSITLPYVEPGIRLIKQSDIAPFVTAMEEFRHELTQAERGLDDVYESMKQDARARLGKLFNEGDYPAAVRGLFAVEWDFPSIEPPAYLLRIAPEVYEQERERVARRFEEAVQLAEQAFLAEFAKLIAHLTERLRDGADGERRVFRDSVVGNLGEFFEKFRRLNVRSNDELDEMVQQAQQLVGGVTPQQLRDNDGLRQHIATEMSVMQSQLEQMMIDRPRRSILRTRPAHSGDDHGLDR
jgi:hypothetical protein